MMITTKPLPNTELPLTAPFWAGLREHRLTVQRCPNCGAARYPAATICPRCTMPGGEWVDVDPIGTLWSYVVYHRALGRGFAEDVPYAVGLVEIDGDLQIIARVEAPLDSIEIGMAVRAKFTEVTADVTLLSWAPTAGE